MVKFVFPSGRAGWVYGVRGKIIGSKTWTETHVSSSGGGGYIHKGTGQIHAPTVHSTTVERGEVWIRNKDGKDICIPHNLEGLQGHDVLVLWGNVNDTDPKNGPHLYWRNFSTDKHQIIAGHSRKMFLSDKDGFNGILTFIYGWVGTIAGSAILFAMFGDNAVGFGVIGAFLGLFIGIFVGLIARAISLGWKIQERTKILLESLAQLSLRSDVEFNG
jgi:hypothetical protein